MDLYSGVSYELSKSLTGRYSTSFSLSSKLLDGSIRRHIYAIYGVVRLADEIVDTYRGTDAEKHLEELKEEVYRAIRGGFSVNPIVHAFAATARQYGIGSDLVDPFFDSMQIDLRPQAFNQELYETYIYGSAEVVGLMCLRVFVEGNNKLYEQLKEGARALGAAYQKVNFLRDMKADYKELGRVYFPGVLFESFTEDDKQLIVADIERDFEVAKQSIDRLPASARRAVKASYYFYKELLRKLDNASAAELTSSRLRVRDANKLFILAKAAAGI